MVIKLTFSVNVILQRKLELDELGYPGVGISIERPISLSPVQSWKNILFMASTVLLIQRPP